jgi:hypothetical protein
MGMVNRSVVRGDAGITHSVNFHVTSDLNECI